MTRPDGLAPVDGARFRSLLWLGGFMALIAAADLLANFGDWYELLWFCPLAAAAVSFACFRRNAAVMTVALVLAVPAQSMWMLDFLLEMIGAGQGRTRILAFDGPFILFGSFLTHFSVVPAAAWGVWKMGFKRGTLIPAMAAGAVILIASFLLSPDYKNINCVLYSCDALHPTGNFLQYFLIHSLLVWAVIIPVSYVSLRWLFRVRAARQVSHANNA